MSRAGPWLIAVWPGMGSVALRAGQTLRESLSMELLEELPARDFHEVEKVVIRDGLATGAVLPSQQLYRWNHPGDGPDLLLFHSEAQPSRQGLELCRLLLARAVQLGATRVFTFAALGTQMDPRRSPRVFGVANQRPLIQELEEHGVQLLRKGNITGLNGVMLAAAAERRIPAACLLGEIPVFAGGIPNPAASARVLEVFQDLSGIQLNLVALEQQASAVQQGLVDLLERMTRVVGKSTSSEAEDTDVEEVDESCLSDHERQHLEALFLQVSEDRSQAVRLKDELDRLGVYEQYEDRFLDLFS